MNEQLITDLRSRAKFHYGLDWKLLRHAADALEGQSVTPESIVAYLNERGIKLLPWQVKKLGVEETEKVPV